MGRRQNLIFLIGALGGSYLRTAVIANIVVIRVNVVVANDLLNRNVLAANVALAVSILVSVRFDLINHVASAISVVPMVVVIKGPFF